MTKSLSRCAEICPLADVSGKGSISFGGSRIKIFIKGNPTSRRGPVEEDCAPSCNLLKKIRVAQRLSPGEEVEGSVYCPHSKQSLKILVQKDSGRPKRRGRHRRQF